MIFIFFAAGLIFQSRIITRRSDAVTLPPEDLKLSVDFSHLKS